MSYEIEITPSQNGSMQEVVVQTIVVNPVDGHLNTESIEALGQNLAIGQILHGCPHGCQNIYSLDKEILKRHIGLVHEKRTPLECMNCYAVFVDPKKLKQHRYQVHGERGQYQCNQCSASFRDQGHVNRHIAIVHEKKRYG